MQGVRWQLHNDTNNIGVWLKRSYKSKSIGLLFVVFGQLDEASKALSERIDLDPLYGYAGAVKIGPNGAPFFSCPLIINQ